MYKHGSGSSEEDMEMCNCTVAFLEGPELPTSEKYEEPGLSLTGVQVTGNRGKQAGESYGKWDGGQKKKGLGERSPAEVSSHCPLHIPQCCIDLEHGVLRLKAPFPELPFLPLYQEPGQ